MILSVLSSLALVSGLMVVRAKNPVHSVLFPIPVFRNTSGLLLLLGLDFFAMIFPVVHIGAIAVSFLFVVMMFHIQIAEIHEEVLRYLPVSGIIGLIFWWEMFFILDNESIPLLPTQKNTTSLRYMVYAGKVRSWTNLETLGNLLYTYYSVWFLVPSLILLVAMIGAIVLTMHRTTKVKRQDVFRRNAIDSRRTIMRGMTDLLKESSFILVRLQFVRWPSWSYRWLGALILKISMPFLFVGTVSSLFYVLCLNLGFSDLIGFLNPDQFLQKLKASLLVHSLRSIFRLLGFEGNLILLLCLVSGLGGVYFAHAGSSRRSTCCQSCSGAALRRSFSGGIAHQHRLRPPRRHLA